MILTAKQNQKFPFHFFFRFAVEGWGEETREKCKEIFWFLHTRVRERVRGALVRFTTQSERTRQFRATTRSARAISRNQDLTQNTFELCPINTATLPSLNRGNIRIYPCLKPHSKYRPDTSHRLRVGDLTRLCEYGDCPISPKKAAKKATSKKK